jgi:nucleotide-binding universal stress UspA family protein
MYKYAMTLAGERNAGLMVIHILNQRSIKAAKMLAYFLNESPKDVVQKKTFSALQCINYQLSSFLKKDLKNYPTKAGPVEHILVYTGKVAEEIVERANRFGCEAIVLGSHTSSILTRFLSDSTRKKVLKKTCVHGFF